MFENKVIVDLSSKTKVKSGANKELTVGKLEKGKYVLYLLDYSHNG